MAPVPLLRERGEFQAVLGTRNAQLAYAPLDGLTLVANGFLVAEEGAERNGTLVRSGGWLVEAGAGPHGELLVPNLRWEVLGGLGFGRVERGVSGAQTRSFLGEGLRTFVQPNVGYVTPWFEVTGTLRLASLKYTRFEATGYTEEALRAEGIPERLTGQANLVAEPVVTVKLGYKWVKLYLQRGWSFRLIGDLAAEDNIGSIGVSVDVAQWFHSFRWSNE